MMQIFFKRIDKWCDKESSRWILSLSISFLMILTVFLCIHPAFMTIDDARLRYVFAGYASGTPVSSYLFTYYPLSWLLSMLYSWFPALPWYALYQFALIGLSCALIGKTIYKLGRKNHLRGVACVGLHMAAYLFVCLISTILMHFEITAAITGTAGVILLAGIDIEHDSCITQRLDALLSLGCILSCFIIQFNAFYAICCYLLVAVVFIVLKGIQSKKLKQTLKKLVLYLIFLVVGVASVKFIENMSKDTPAWEEYYKYNKYRVSFWDYPHIEYTDNPELFEEIGWSEPFYELTEDMYFMDEKFNIDNLNQFTKPFSWFDVRELPELWSGFKENMQYLLQREPLARLQLVLLFVFLAFYIISLFLKEVRKRCYPSIIASLCCLLGTGILTSYLAAKGRLPLRAWLMAVIPCLVLSLLFVLPIWEMIRPQKKRTRQVVSLIGVIVILGATTGLTFTYRRIIATDWKYRRDCNNKVERLEAYVIEHPDNIYVYDTDGAQNYNVFKGYPREDERPINAFVWGSSYLYTPVYYEQLAANGRKELLTEDLFDENVYYIAKAENSQYAGLLLNYLQTSYDGVTMEAVDWIESDFVVYKLNKKK